MSVLSKNYTLNNGVEIPKLGLGTWFIDDADAADAVRTAVVAGYCHIDTAQAYGNERGVDTVSVLKVEAANHQQYVEMTCRLFDIHTCNTICIQ